MVLLLVILASFLIVCSRATGLEKFDHPIKVNGNLRFLVVGDWGRKGDYNQSAVALQMGKIGEELDIDFVVSTGDNFYTNGLTGEDDPNFLESFTNVYKAKSLQNQWYTVLGNHDYRGDVMAQLSPYLRKIDSRWICLRSFIINAEFAEIFMVDTTPFVKEYFVETEHTYDWRNVMPQTTYTENVLKDLENALSESRAKWKIVVGHHAIRSVGHHGDTNELVERLLPILRVINLFEFDNFLHYKILNFHQHVTFFFCWIMKFQAYDVDLYMNGHDHCLEHISDTQSPIQFLTSGAGSKAWRGDVKGLNREDMKFFYDGQGFMSVQLTPTHVEIEYYDVFGKVLHKWSRSKQLHHIVI